MKFIVCIFIISFPLNTSAQTCSCEKEFLYIKKTVEQNFAGFPDKLKVLTKPLYSRKVKELLQLSRGRFSGDNCLLIIHQYLGLFKCNHLGFRNNFNPTVIDTNFSAGRPLFYISDAKVKELESSRSWEGIYYFIHDSSYKIAVVKDITPLHDYVGVMLESKFSHWKRGMIKFEGKLENDSLMMGLLYMRNHRPKREGFNLFENNNRISGDWIREGAVKQVMSASAPPLNTSLPDIEARQLSEKTFYIKARSFDLDYRSVMDSVLKANEQILAFAPNLIIDVRNNGGGSDNVWAPLIPYVCSGPITYTGIDAFCTETNISGWKKYLDDENLSKELRNNISNIIGKMEKGKGEWVNIGEDEIDSSIQAKAFPKKVVILINKGCGSSTEEFLLAARQSSKVTLVGENTIGNLDYSNVVETSFSCFPYILLYATTKSRRLKTGNGIDNIGIAPTIRLSKNSDWVQEALKLLEK